MPKKLKLSANEEAEVIREAKDRFKYCTDYFSEQRQRYLEDLKFAEADSDNGWQWPNEIRRNRDVDERPCLTMNKTRQHNLNIINDAKQNKVGVKIIATGNGSSVQSAQVYMGIVRRIEYQSSAQVAYDTATEFMVKAGMGFWRVVTDYVNEKSFDQEIFIKRIKDPLMVFLDPDIDEKDGSDAKYGFVFDSMPLDEYKRQYPEDANDPPPSNEILQEGTSWVLRDHVIRAEYWRMKEEEDELLYIVDPQTGAGKTALLSKLKENTPKEVLDAVLEDPRTRKRDVTTQKVECFIIIGDKIRSHNPWLGKYIPIVRVVGEETFIEGKYDCKGHTRAMKDANRMYNYWTSAAVEFVALQGKSPWIAPAEAIEGYETYWNTANTVNHSVLPYNGIDDKGNKLEAPQRPNPPQYAEAYLTGMKVASEELKAVSGQWQADMGEPGNERSGKAINERQRQGDNATYHYIDNLAIGVRFTGKILIDLIPKIYDTERERLIVGEDGVENMVQINPNATDALQQESQPQEGEEDAKTVSIFNPRVGNYEVEADVGPAYQTRRQEAYNAFSQIVVANPALTSIVGDLLFKNADFPGADEIAARLRRMVPAAALGTGPSPEMMELQTANAAMKETIGKLSDHVSKLEIKAKGYEEKRDIQVYDAETKRMTALKDALLTDPETQNLVKQLIAQALSIDPTSIVRANADEIEEETTPENKRPHIAGKPRKAKDGKYYVNDPNRPGKYMMVSMGEDEHAAA